MPNCLVKSTRIDIVTYDDNGNEINREMYKDYGIYTMPGEVKAEAKKLQLQLKPNQKAETVDFLDTSLYEKGWEKGFTF